LIINAYVDTTYFVTGSDIGKYTINTVDDVRTVNKTVHFRPPKNLLTLNELAVIWEKKIRKTLPRVYISEQDLLSIAKGIFTNTASHSFPFQYV